MNRIARLLTLFVIVSLSGACAQSSKLLPPEDALSFSLFKQSSLNSDSQAHCFMIPEEFDCVGSVDPDYYPTIKNVFDDEKFKGEAKDSLELTALKDGQLVHYFFYGIGDSEDDDFYETIRKATGDFVNALKKQSRETATIYLPTFDESIDTQEIVKQIAIAAKLAFYEFDVLKNDQEKKTLKLSIACDTISEDVIVSLSEGIIIGNAVNRARRWGDLPPNIMTPAFLADQVEMLAAKFGCTGVIFGEEQAYKLGMGGFIAVGLGTSLPSKFIVVEYNAEIEDAPTVVLVGKGITHDSGGLSLKTPSNSMLTMKYDMCGGASVLATVLACAQLKPEVNVVGIVPAVENKIGVDCYRPGDVITMMNGKTVEVINTDAEGRLILADALCYAEQQYDPSVIIDVATLTGSCKVALGPKYSGVMTRSDDLFDYLEDASERSGDLVWRLPLHDDYNEPIKSDFADVKNCPISRFGAGASTAACFLNNFVENAEEWAHLDIASTAYFSAGVSYLDKRFARGSSVRLLIDFIMNYAPRHD